MDTSTNLEDLQEQSPEDIYRHGANAQRCISGRFKMSWNLLDNKKTQVLVVVPPLVSQKEYSFKISFEIQKEHLQMLNFAPHDEFRLSLRGAEVQKLPNTPKLSNISMQLVFSKGVHIQWKRQGPNDARKTLNTWSFNSAGNDAKASDSWFFSQDENDISSEASRHKRRHSEIMEVEIQENPKAKDIKKRQRTEAKREKQAANARSSASNHTLSTAINADTQSVSSATKLQGPLPLIQENQSTEPRNIPSSNTRSPETISTMTTIRPSSDIYTVLEDIREAKIVTLIGVVASISAPRKSSTGDWMRLVNLVDPSNYNTHGSGLLKVNCFTKRHKEWLPHPEEGDVLILRSVKIKDYQGSLSGVGYADRLQWAAFSPTKGEFHHGPPNSAPKQEGLADGGFGVPFSPFLQPGPLQTRHCVKLSDWWRNLNKQSHAMNYNPESSRRTHRLISETGPAVPPNGYFDCTVEVLKGFRNSNNMVYTLYVTDYTRNEQMMGVQANWCPASLSEFVVQFEMWDEVATVAETMRHGQYYSIKNARMVTNAKGYPEGKVRENKIVQLDENDTDPHLQALLERKRQWEAKRRTSESDIKYQLIEDAREGKFFHCTVELLRVISNPNRKPCIYVTDYTSHPQLASASLPGLQTLQGRIVKIILSDEQEDCANTASTGAAYCIKKLRLKYSTTEDCFCGILGGNEKLLIKLNPNNTANEHLNGLLRRREAWQRQTGQILLDERKIDPLPSTDETCRDETQSFMLIKDITSPEFHLERYRISARPIDFYPLDLRDAFYQRCSRCNIEIPKTAKACFKCGDFEHEYVQYFYQLYILLKDQDENEIIVSIDDKCPLLKGLKRACIQEDRAALRQFRKRVDPVIGNLTMMHDALKAGKRIEVNTSQICFEIESWLVSESKKAFRLIEFESLDSERLY